MIDNRISTMWITLNSLDLQSFLVLVFTRVQLKDNN